MDNVTLTKVHRLTALFNMALSAATSSSRFLFSRCFLHHFRRISSRQKIKFSTFNTSRLNSFNNISITFIDRDGQHMQVEAKEGQTLLDVAVNNELGIDGFGACGGSLSCSTCHLILRSEDYVRLEEDLGDEEMDLLDLSNHVTETSRLGCQVMVTKELNGMVVTVPRHVNDARDFTKKVENIE